MADKVIWGLVLAGQGPVVQLGAEEVRGLGCGVGAGGGASLAQSLPFSKRNRTEGCHPLSRSPSSPPSQGPALACRIQGEMAMGRPRGCPESVGTSVQPS